MEQNNKILIIVAHHDDEVLGCGGTIAKYSQNSDIYLLVLGEGISARYEKRDQAKKEELLNLQQQSQEVGKVLGVKGNFFFNLPDQRFDTLPFLEIVKKTEKVIKEVKPAKVYTQHPGDLNLDHRITFQAVLTATRPQKDPIKEIYSFEGPSSTEWSFQKINPVFSPNVFEDITLTIDKKIKAMEIYQSEKREFPHPRSKEALLALAKKWGSTIGVKYAEAFELIRSLR